ncbi:hypothetical protein [Bartonella doshiae]|uniref:hypothetical protein n=1 Tax=Bartonella doshiae TaxID=33044 RepID=UPI000AB4F03F|nr:hypothetical protein [Bartonella doshiae]
MAVVTSFYPLIEKACTTTTNPPFSATFPDKHKNKKGKPAHAPSTRTLNVTKGLKKGKCKHHILSLVHYGIVAYRFHGCERNNSRKSWFCCGKMASCNCNLFLCVNGVLGHYDGPFSCFFNPSWTFQLSLEKSDEKTENIGCATRYTDHSTNMRGEKK